MIKRNQKIIILILLILIVVVAIGLLVMNKKDDTDISKLKQYANLQKDDTDISKLKQYVNLQKDDYESSIKKNGYVTQDDALKIVALSTVKIGYKEITVKEYVSNVNKINIKLVENESPYWKIDIGTVDSSYIEWANFKVDYYTGELLYNSVVTQLNVG